MNLRRVLIPGLIVFMLLIGFIIWLLYQYPQLGPALVKSIPGILTFVVTLVTPRAAVTALDLLKPDYKNLVADLFEDATRHALTNLYVQIGTVLAGLLNLIITSLIYIGTGSPFWLNIFSWAVLIGALGLVFWMWLWRGIGTINLYHYRDTVNNLLPPWRSWLTKVRYSMLVIALIFAILVPFNV